MNKKYSRREFLSKNIVGSATLLGSGWLLTSFKLIQATGSVKPTPTATHKKLTLDPTTPEPGQDGTKTIAQQTPKKADNTCDDLTGVAPGEIDKRKKFAYVNNSPIPDSRCGNCKLFLPPGPGKPCGGCLLFKGPVRETGYCTYWAPTEE